MLAKFRRAEEKKLQAVEDRAEARALGRHIAGLAALIAQRFGSVPERWQRYIVGP